MLKKSLKQTIRPGFSELKVQNPHKKLTYLIKKRPKKIQSVILLFFTDLKKKYTVPIHKGIWQIFTLNWGVLLGWSVFFENLTIEIIILYMAGIFWTLGYDTI